MITISRKADKECKTFYDFKNVLGVYLESLKNIFYCVFSISNVGQVNDTGIFNWAQIVILNRFYSHNISHNIRKYCPLPNYSMSHLV